MPEITIIPLNVVTPSGTKTRTFAPSNASLADLRKILVEDAIIKPHVKFHVDGIIIGATAELHMKWTEVIREIHVCEDTSLVSRDAPCIPADSQHAERSVTYPSPTQTPPPDDTNKRLQQSQRLCDSTLIPSAQVLEKACDVRADGEKEHKDCSDSASSTPKPCLSPTVSDCPDIPCDGHSSKSCEQPASDAHGCFAGEEEDSVGCGFPVTSEPCLSSTVPESPCGPPDECDPKHLNQLCNTKGQDCAMPRTDGDDESSSSVPFCSDDRDINQRESEECLNKGCFNDTVDDSTRNGDCCSQKEYQEDSSRCADRSPSETKRAGFKYRPLRLSSDSTLIYGEFNSGKPWTPRAGGFSRNSPSGAPVDKRTPSRPNSAARLNFNLSLSSRRSDEVSCLEGQHNQDRAYSPEQPYETSGTPSHFESPAKDEALAGTICTPRSEDRSLQKDFTQRLRSGTIRETEARSIAFGASVNVGGVTQPRLNLSSISSGEIKRDDAFSSTVSIDIHTDVLWRQRLDIVNTVKTVMQAGCADSNRFAAAFGGLQIDASLFQGVALSANGPRPGSFEAVQPANGDTESVNEDAPIEGDCVSDDLDQCTSPSISNTSVGLNTGFILSNDEERSTSGNCTESTRPSASSIESVVPPLAKVPLYRLYAPTFPDHFYTTNAAERDACAAYGYILESTAAQILASPSPEGCSVPFFRIYRNKEHFYTTDVREKERVVGWAGTRDEGIAGYVYAERCVGTVPLYRLYNPESDDHFYTTSAPERETCVQSGQWNDEGVACYVYP